MFQEAYIANVTIFAGTFAPSGWMFCQGQSLSISEYTTLFSLIGTTFGGDGQVNFNLPDFRGRAAIHAGQGPSLPSYIPGQIGGNEQVTLIQQQLPQHTHAFIAATGKPVAYNSTGDQSAAVFNAPAVLQSGHSAYATAAAGNVLGTSITPATTPSAGGQDATDIRSPYLAMNYIIAVEGIYPSRN